MAIEITGMNARMALDQIAKMAYGSKESEGISGGRGNIGLVDGQVVKFNTHWTERLKSTTPEMRASCNELRTRLSAIATELLAPVGDNDVNAAAKQRALADIRRSLGLDPAGQQVVSRKLLDRTVVAAVVNKLAEAGVHDSWGRLEANEVRALSSQGVNTTFDAVSSQVAVDKATAAQMSRDQSMPRAPMTAAQRQVFADVLGTTSADHVEEFFTGPLERSFEAAEKDLPRGQRTIVNGRMFGGGETFDAADSAAYRQELVRVFNGNENMLRIFNGLAHQGFLSGALQARLAGVAQPTLQQFMNCSTPFATVTRQTYTYELIAHPNGDYEMNATFTRHGSVHMGANGPGELVDKDRSFDEIRARVFFGPARAGDQNPYLMTVKGADGEDVSVPYHLDVVWAESEVKLEFLTSKTTV